MCSSWNCPTTSAIRSTHILAKIRWKSPRDRVGGGFRSLLLDNFPRRETPAFPSICTTAIFQFTSPRRDELGKSTIMSPQGDEQLCRPFLCFVPYFNSRLRKETNYSIYTFLLILLLFQLTSPQGDEHEQVTVYTNVQSISTHISVRRRTMQIMQNAEHFVISTRVSARETNNIYKYIKGWKLYN